MTSSAFSLPAAEDEAALWAARLDGSTLSPSDRAELDRWLNAHPQHRSLLSSYCQLSADLEQQLPQLGAHLDLQLQPPSRRRWIKNIAWAAGSIAAAAAVAFLLLGRTSTGQTASLATTVGQRQEFTLVDGSRIEMNAQTSLAVTVSAAQRHIQLGSGQAFFSVTPDAKRPFIVETPHGAVQVTGTRFDVRAEGANALEVIVLEGSVQVRPGETASRSTSPVALVAGQRYLAGDPAIVEDLPAAALADMLAWRQGQVVFDGVPLREALARFGRYHGRGLVASAGAAELPIGGRYSLDDLDGFLSALEDIFPVQVSRTLSGTVQVRVRGEQ